MTEKRKAYLQEYDISKEPSLKEAKAIREKSEQYRIERLESTTGSQDLDLKNFFCPKKKFLASEVLCPKDLVLFNIKEKTFHLLAENQNSNYIAKNKNHHLRDWHHFLNQVREFFNKQSFLEVRTPYLVESPGIETYIDPFETRWLDKKLFLPTSPEFYLKKILAEGERDIYEIKSAFRQEQLSQHHQPEFLLLEWYRVYAGLDYIKEDVINLIRFLLQKPLKVNEATIRELFSKIYEFELRPKTKKEELLSLANKNEISCHHTDSWDEVFHRLWLEKIEPHLSEGLWFIKDFPPQMAALAKISSKGWAHRMEVYWNGFELANAYFELCDPLEQEARFHQTNQERQNPLPIDQEFLEALKYGIPPASGIALGLERLFMSVYGLKDIKEAVFFEYKD